jgi:hypothetical protein
MQWYLLNTNEKSERYASMQEMNALIDAAAVSPLN